jgi:hypothetical protein
VILEKNCILNKELNFNSIPYSHLRNDTNLESANIGDIKWFADWKGQ